MYSENLLMKHQPIEEHQEMIPRGPIHKADNRAAFNVLQSLCFTISTHLGSAEHGIWKKISRQNQKKQNQQE